MSTRGKYEVLITVAMRFDDQDSAVETAAAYGVATREIAHADRIPLEMQCQLRVCDDDEPALTTAPSFSKAN